jgi:hypothetical protein
MLGPMLPTRLWGRATRLSPMITEHDPPNCPICGAVWKRQSHASDANLRVFLCPHGRRIDVVREMIAEPEIHDDSPVTSQDE